MKLHRYGAHSQIEAPINLKLARKTQKEEAEECRNAHKPALKTESADPVEPNKVQPEPAAESIKEVVSEAPASPTIPKPPKQPSVVALADEIFPDGL